MNIMDSKKAVTAEDLIRRYNLENLKSDRKSIQTIKENANNTNNLLNNFIEATVSDLQNLQDQVDGNIATWFFSGVPTLENNPAVDWTSDEDKNNHLGDLYYDKDTGYAYRFSLEENTYKWVKLSDSDIAEALALANAAQDTADSKRRVFVTTPSPPYDVGDIWIKEDTDLYRCAVSRSAGNFNEAEWVKATDYSNDDYAKNVEAILNQFKQTVETDYATKVLLNTTKESILGVVETKTTEVETTLIGYIDLFSVDLDLYNLTIPVNNDKKPLENKTYEIGYYSYFKGNQVSVTPTSSNSNAGITVSYANSKINLTVDNDTAITNLTNEFIFNFNYTDSEDETEYVVQKKIVVVLAEKGATGEKGDTGLTGATGADGADGKSAYQIWLDAGNTGTEEEYLESLKGEKGDTGDQGPQGIQGEKGSTGEQGPQGPQGLKGDKGDTGDQGPQGIQGEKGDKGDKGDTGDTGPQGPPGIQGPPGANGTSTYFYVRYSENATGNPMTEAPTANSKYMGVASTTSPTAPTSSSGYVWSLIKGADGPNGTPGQPGENGQSSYLHIKYSEDGSTFTPADEEAGYALGEKPSAYIGQYVDFTEADSTNFSDYTWYKFTEDIDGTLNNLQNQISENATTTANNYQDIIGRLDGYATVENVTEVTNRVENLTTSTEQAINIIEDIQTNGVTQIHTETGYSFDKDGLNIEKTNAPTGSKLDEAGLEIKDKTSAAETTQFYSGYVDDEMAEKTTELEKYKGQTVTYSNNFIFENYLQSGNGRWEDVEDEVYGKGIGFFIGGGS